MMIAMDEERTYLISGNGDIIEPDEGIVAIGSGGTVAQGAATALLKNTDLDAKGIVQEAMKIAASICIYTNEAIVIEEI
jgi:ATP-dependent HslUV protease subunit HslV